MSDADVAAPIGRPKTDTRGRQVYKCGDCKRRYTADAERPRFPEQVKRQAVQMRIVSAIISAAARVVGASILSVNGRVKKGRLRVNGCAQ